MNPKKPKFVRIAVLAVLTALTSGFASAQDPSSSVPQDGNPGPPSTGAGQSQSVWGGPPKPAGRTYMGLGTDRLISLNPLLKSQLLFQMDLTQGYDDGVILFPARTGVYYTLWTPRIALLGRTSKSEYMFQYTPTLSYFANAGPIGFEAFHQTAAELHTEVTRDWGWDSILTVSSGSYPVSLLNGFNFVSVGNTSAVNIDSILLLSTRSYFNLDASVGLHWEPSPRDKLLVGTTYNYANFPPNNVPGNVPGHIHRDSVTANYTHSVSLRLNLLANGDIVHVFGPLACTTYGGQFGASYDIRRGTTISGTEGPEFGGGTCANSILVEYTGYLTSRLARKWVGYLTAARTNTGQLHSALGSGLTETFGGGVTRQLNARLDTRIDAGYIRVKSLPTLPTSFNAQGKFISGRIGWTLAAPVELSLQYSRVYQTLSNLTLDRNQASLTLEWRPNPRAAF